MVSRTTSARSRDGARIELRSGGKITQTAQSPERHISARGRELLAQPVHLRLHRIRAALLLEIVQAFGKPLLRDDTSLIAQQGFEHDQLRSCQLELRSGDRREACGRVELDATESQRATQRCARA